MTSEPHQIAAPILPIWTRVTNLVPGLLLCLAITALAALLQMAEARIAGRAWLEALVIAILLGTLVRTAWTPGRVWAAGIEFGAKILLETAIVLLGATFSATMIASVGPALLVGIVGVVGIAIAVSYGLGRAFGLPHRMATLIACGNSICGNSAIAAVAPVIGADGDDVAASIAFTAVLGVAVVLGLPVLAIALHMTPRAFGVFAGLTVYAVPQVLAATAPISSVSAQIGALVKLVRVLMLGPVVLVLSLLSSGEGDVSNAAERAAETGVSPKRRKVSIHHLAPWFIIGFLLMLGLRTAGLVPERLVAPLSATATWLTIVSMSALGLGVDVRVVAKAGPRVTVVVVLSLLALGLVALLLIRLVGLG